MGKEQRIALRWEAIKLAGEAGAGKHAAGWPHVLPLPAFGGLTWKCPVAGAGAAGPGASEPLGMVIHPTTGLFGEIEVAIES